MVARNADTGGLWRELRGLTRQLNATLREQQRWIEQCVPLCVVVEGLEHQQLTAERCAPASSTDNQSHEERKDQICQQHG